MPSPYTGPIIDPHHHLWDLELGKHPWLASPVSGNDSNARLRRSYLIDDYLADSKGQNVVATVHVEAAWLDADCVGETRWLDGLAHRSGIARRYVAHVALDRPDAPELLAQQAAFPDVVGIRDILSWHRDPARSFRARRDVMDDPAWRRGLAQLRDHGLSFDLMIFAGQLADASRLAAAFPDQQFVLNHSGSPVDRDAEAMAAWHRGIAELAKAPNVAIKISALTGYDPDWTLASIRPLILHCIEAFGPERAMFASDFPVTSLHATYSETYAIYRAVAAGFTAAEQRALFHDTARRIYRIRGAA
ncbi:MULTISPECIES: amidohydrolase family protein [unclassified Mesorhizobium]|uniref:amidohydrolase family protein n=1 Tax=unclassified Mesorhizobium TaxID=325217 RepID=UPI000FDBF7DC|nr:MULTISPECIES: amidohydrolase family protein [unclassified Mesorhizobium]TGT71879.1 hydrolase [Mesorhizobium sp. M2E.F.Ca.ET.166.01.1.1]TGV99406.1 hydrolase [Mesorhizobium sp. M2E.F.Ca.ET.154.01.1.1]